MTNKFKTVLVDTSLQIERCKGAHRIKKVENCLDQFRFRAISSFSRYEFKCSWLEDCLYIYNLCSERGVSRLQDVQDIINNHLGSHPRNHRRVQRCFDIINNYLNRVSGSNLLDVRVVRFRQHLKYIILSSYDWWATYYTHEFTENGCTKAKIKPQKVGSSINLHKTQCKTTPKCGIDRFFENNKEHFLRIRDAIADMDTPSQELAKAKSIIDKAESDPSILFNQGAMCRSLGDLIIAIDGRDMDYYAANNDKEWGLLAQVMGKQLVNPISKP